MKKASGRRQGGQLPPEAHVRPLKKNRRFCKQTHAACNGQRHLRSGAASPTWDAVETIPVPETLPVPIVDATSAIGALGCSCRPV